LKSKRLKILKKQNKTKNRKMTLQRLVQSTVFKITEKTKNIDIAFDSKD
jgi:hypothetical protein